MENGHSSVPVRAAILVPGCFVRDLNRRKVKAMRSSYLLNLLFRIEATSTRQQIQPRLSALEERCRTVEFRAGVMRKSRAVRLRDQPPVRELTVKAPLTVQA